MVRPQPKGGSRKGKPNKINADLRAMVLGALDQAGGEDYLAKQARAKNPAAFLALVGKCLPRDVNITANVSLASLISEARQRLEARKGG